MPTRMVTATARAACLRRAVQLPLPRLGRCTMSERLETIALTHLPERWERLRCVLYAL